MHILVVNNLFPPVIRGGYEVECRDVVEHLRETHRVTVLTTSLDAATAPAEPDVLRVLPWVGDLRRRDAALAAVHTARAQRIVPRVLAQVRPDAIYVWNGAGMPAATLRALQRSGLPLLVRVCEYWFAELFPHDTFTRYLPGGALADAGGPHGLLGAFTRAVNRLPGWRVETQAPFPAAVCWNSEFVAEKAPAPPGFEVVHKAIVIPSNARTQELDAVPRAPVPGRVLYVGRLDAAKGSETVIRAVAQLPEADLVLCGGGTDAERAHLEGLAARLGVRARFTGPVRGAALEAEISAASAWCVPSVWPEPAPLTCTEAALCRVPAVFSRVGGIPEMFADGTQALFHEPGDAEGCATALANCLAGGPAVETRVAAALARGRELSFGPYLAAMDSFLAEGLRSLGHVA